MRHSKDIIPPNKKNKNSDAFTKISSFDKNSSTENTRCYRDNSLLKQKKLNAQSSQYYTISTSVINLETDNRRNGLKLGNAKSVMVFICHNHRQLLSSFHHN